jgi:hypothetical protein
MNVVPELQGKTWKAYFHPGNNISTSAENEKWTSRRHFWGIAFSKSEIVRSE